MAKARAKKKRRQRARAAEGPAGARVTAGGGAKGTGGGGAKDARGAKGASQPSRFDVRDGVARPKALWAPFPLTEIGMAAGIAIFGLGFATNDVRTLAIGAIVLAVVTGELCLREHFSGFRSHTLLLAALPVAVAHGLVVLAITRDYRGPVALAVDLVAGGALAWWLHGRFIRAHERNRAA